MVLQWTLHALPFHHGPRMSILWSLPRRVLMLFRNDVCIISFRSLRALEGMMRSREAVVIVKFRAIEYPEYWPYCGMALLLLGCGGYSPSYTCYQIYLTVRHPSFT